MKGKSKEMKWKGNTAQKFFYNINFAKNMESDRALQKSDNIKKLLDPYNRF